MKKWLRRMKSGSSVMAELFQFLWKQRLWWLIPMVTILLLFSLLLLLASSTPLAPFVYTLF